MQGPQIRIASTIEDVYAVCDVANAAFGVTGPPWATRARRLSSAGRTAADPWLLEEDGRPVSALLAYPLTFGTPRGEVRGGVGLGAVSTLPDARRRGHAGLLCRRVGEHYAERGRRIGLLFSAIAPGYYERLGYRVCPAWRFRCSRLEGLAESGPRAPWFPLDPRRSRAELADLYVRAHRGELHLHRDEEGWRRTFETDPEDWWLGLGSPADGPRGYARFQVKDKDLHLAELLLPDPADEGPALRGLAGLALELELERMDTWLPPSPTIEAWFEDEGREHTLPMISGLEQITPSRFWSSDYF